MFFYLFLFSPFGFCTDLFHEPWGNLPRRRKRIRLPILEATGPRRWTGWGSLRTHDSRDRGRLRLHRGRCLRGLRQRQRAQRVLEQRTRASTDGHYNDEIAATTASEEWIKSSGFSSTYPIQNGPNQIKSIDICQEWVLYLATQGGDFLFSTSPAVLPQHQQAICAN